jgi:dephospho-CoA kinase
MRRLEERDGHNFNVDAFIHSTEMRASQIIDSIKLKGTPGFVLENESTLEVLHKQIDRLMAEFSVPEMEIHEAI